MDFVSLLTFKLVFGMPETSLFIGFFSTFQARFNDKNVFRTPLSPSLFAFFFDVFGFEMPQRGCVLPCTTPVCSLKRSSLPFLCCSLFGSFVGFFRAFGLCFHEIRINL